jgi:hypothetical protein
MYKIEYKNLQYKVYIVRIIIKNIFTLHIFDIIIFYIFTNICYQFFSYLTLTKSRMQNNLIATIVYAFAWSQLTTKSQLFSTGSDTSVTALIA